MTIKKEYDDSGWNRVLKTFSNFQLSPLSYQLPFSLNDTSLSNYFIDMFQLEEKKVDKII